MTKSKANTKLCPNCQVGEAGHSKETCIKILVEEVHGLSKLLEYSEYEADAFRYHAEDNC